MGKSGAAAEIKASYEAWWSNVRAAVETQIAAGETDLSRILHRTFANAVGAPPPGDPPSLVFGREVPAPYLTAHRMGRDWIADMVIEQADRIEADAIIETGSGWGYNLFNIWLRGGRKVPCHAYEYTEAGRETCTRVRDAARDGPEITVHAFDYHAADLSAVAGRYQRPLIYTSHSIEQIANLPQSCIEAFLATAPEVTVMHFEPVSWQFDPDSEASERVRRHCERSGYNDNLWPLLELNQAAGRLTIEETMANVMAPKLTNSSSLIRWCKTPPA
jgi:hypothetical protein